MRVLTMTKAIAHSQTTSVKGKAYKFSTRERAGARKINANLMNTVADKYSTYGTLSAVMNKTVPSKIKKLFPILSNDLLF